MNPGESAPVLIDPHTPAKTMLPVGRRAAATLERVGLDALLQLVLEGHAQTAIAARLGISQASLAGWLANLRGADAGRYSEALRASAESMLDQAMAILAAAEPTTPDVMKARALSDLLTRKAGIRNRAYRDRIDSGVALVAMGSSDQPVQVPSFVIVVHPPREDLGRTFDHEGDG